MDKQYTAKITQREPRPRSKRLREQGIGSSAGATVVMSGTGGGVNISGNSHTHENKAYLDQITTDKENYVYLTQLGDATDPETGAPIVQRVTEKAKVGYADKAGMAHDLDEDSPVRQQFLSKLADDVAKGHITFEKGVTALLTSYFKGGAHFGNFVKGLAGAMIDEIGNAEFESITARGYLKVFELIYNRLNALEGTTSFADVGTIEEVADGDNGTQILAMRKRWDGDFTAFQPGDIVYGYVNNLHNGTTVEYYKAWAWIKAVDRAANTLTVVPYPDTEVPAKTNHALAPSMIITRWGNNIEANAYTYANKDYSAVIAKRGDNEYVNVRQSTFYISCEDGNIVELMGVNKPILEAANYGTVLGKMPAGLLDPATQELVNKDQPYLFARGIIVQDLIRIDYEGKTTRTANYRGVWDAATAASVSDYYRSTAGTYDTVTWNGDLWQCIATGTTDEPSETTGSWVNMTGGREEKELRIWIINPTANIISVRRTEVRPEKVGCTVSLHSSDNSTRIFDSSYDLLLEGAKLVYSLDGLTWHDFVMGSTEPLDLEDGSGAIELENGTASDSILTVGGDDMPTSEIGDRIYFELREADTGKLLAAAQVPVVKDGERAPFQSTVFIRTNTEPARPTGGTYEAPVPTSTPAWSDAIPEGEAVLWASTRIFDDKLQTEWETPRQMTDTATYDVEFSDIDQDPGTPSTAPTKWYDPVKDKATKDFTKMLWRAERQKKNGTWGDWTIVRIKGEKGDKGITGDWTSYAFKQSETKPATPTDNQHTIPTGWQDAPTGTGKWWLTKALINGTTQKPGTWSEPVQCTAEDGKPGAYTDFKYKSHIRGQSPALLDRTVRNPNGWSDTPPTLFAGYDLWMILAKIDYNNDVIGQWSIPVRISGEKGEPGEDGQDGAPGIDGRDGLMVYPAGYFGATTTYRATSETAPVVKYGENYYVLKRGTTYSAASMPTNRKNPAGDVAYGGADTRWQVFDKFNAIFADILMADFAKLSSAVFYGDWMISQQGKRNGSTSTEYQYFKDGSFVPNFAVNFRTGEMQAYGCKIQGGEIGIGNNKFRIDENGLSYGDVSSWALNTGSKMLLSPQIFRLQNQDEDIPNAFCRVAFGQQADPAGNYKFGTVGYIYRFDASDNTNKAMQAAIKILSLTKFGYGVALQTQGAIMADGLICEKPYVYEAKNNSPSMLHIGAGESGSFVINSAYNNAPAQLASFYIIRYKLGLKSNAPLFAQFKVAVMRGSKPFVVTSNSNESIYEGAANSASNSITLTAGKIYVFSAISNGTTSYWTVTTDLL